MGASQKNYYWLNSLELWSNSLVGGGGLRLKWCKESF